MKRRIRYGRRRRRDLEGGWRLVDDGARPVFRGVAYTQNLIDIL